MNDDEFYYSVTFYDTATYSNPKLYPAMERLLNGDTSSIIQLIKNEQYSHIKFVFFDSFDKELDLAAIDNNIQSLSEVIMNMPSVKSLSFTFNIDAIQTNKIVDAISKSNVSIFSLTSDRLSSEGMSILIDTIKQTNIIELYLGSHRVSLDDAVVNAMNFEDTSSLKVFTLSYDDLSENAFVNIFNNIAGSSIEDFTIFSENTQPISGAAISNIDFSLTNINHLELCRITLEDDALCQLNLVDSNITYLWIDDVFISKENFSNLSSALKGSPVKELVLSLKNSEEGDLAYLDLKGTDVDELRINQWIGGDLATNITYLDLSDTNVKTLNLSGNGITDSDVSLLNLKNTNIEYLSLIYNPITESGIKHIEEMIKGTTIKEVYFYNTKYDPVQKEFHKFEFTLINNDASTDNIIQLSDVIGEQTTCSDDLSFSAQPIIQSNPLLVFDMVQNIV